DTYALSYKSPDVLTGYALDLAFGQLPGTSLPIVAYPAYDQTRQPMTGRLNVFAPTATAGDYANLTPTPSVTPDYVRGVATGDFDGDGKLDVAMAYDQVGTPHKVVVYEAQ